MLSYAKALSLIKAIPLFAIGAVGVGLVIAWHEFGHFLLAKLFNMKTPSFSIGFGPKLISRKFGETEFSLSAIPWGGYVEFAQAPDPSIHPASPDTQGERGRRHSDYLEHKPYWQKMLVIGGGILFNLIFAYVVFIALYAVGVPASPLFYPENAKPVITAIQADGPAAKAGMANGDRIIAVDGKPVGDRMTEHYADLINAKASQEVEITYGRGQETKTAKVVLGSKKVGGKEMGVLGVTAFEMDALPGKPFGESIKLGFTRVNNLVCQLVSVFYWMFSERTTEGMGGPIMIFSQTIKSAERGVEIFFAFLALISVNLAIVNLIPLPILDGGQAAITTIEAIIRRPLHIRVREIMAIGTWLLFILLTLYLSFKDIKFLGGWHGSEKTESAGK